MSKTKLYFRNFTEKCRPEHTRLCYVYSEAIPKANAHIAFYDSECEAWFSLGENDWISNEECAGLRWAYIPTPSEFADDNKE